MIKKKNEFRRNNSKDGRGHPVYIHGEVKGDYIFIGITHSNITNEQENIPLKINPNPKDKSPAFMRRNRKKIKLLLVRSSKVGN